VEKLKKNREFYKRYYQLLIAMFWKIWMTKVMQPKKLTLSSNYIRIGKLRLVELCFERIDRETLAQLQNVVKSRFNLHKIFFKLTSHTSKIFLEYKAVLNDSEKQFVKSHSRLHSCTLRWNLKKKVSIALYSILQFNLIFINWKWISSTI
jgi:hypothetical protein